MKKYFVVVIIAMGLSSQAYGVSINGSSKSGNIITYHVGCDNGSLASVTYNEDLDYKPYMSKKYKAFSTLKEAAKNSCIRNIKSDYLKSVYVKKGVFIFTKRFGEYGIEKALATNHNFAMTGFMGKIPISSSRGKFRALKYYKNRVAFEDKDGYIKHKRTKAIDKGLRNGTYKTIPLIDNYYKLRDDHEEFYVRESDLE